MGKKSVKEDKSVYQLSREKAELTRDAAAERMLTSASRLEKIENGKTTANPVDIVAMAECYKDPQLCNYYCTHDCELGKAFVPEIEVKSLSQVTLEVLLALDELEKEKTRLERIGVDDDITEDEYEDFNEIHENLHKISMAIDTLQLWVDNKIGKGQFNGKLGE